MPHRQKVPESHPRHIQMVSGPRSPGRARFCFTLSPVPKQVLREGELLGTERVDQWLENRENKRTQDLIGVGDGEKEEVGGVPAPLTP